MSDILDILNLIEYFKSYNEVVEDEIIHLENQFDILRKNLKQSKE
jgi:hypothetical protein